MKKLLLLVGLFLAPSSLVAGIQDGITIPDAIQIYNGSGAIIEVDGSCVSHDQSITIDAQGKGSFLIKSDKRKYVISYPTYKHNSSPISEIFSTAFLDFSTIQLLSGDINKLFPAGLDSISILNDTHYPIAAVYVLSAMRSRSCSIDPQETVSKIVSSQDNQKTGFLELIDGNRKKHTFSFPRRTHSRTGIQTSDWHEITLRAQTIGWFNKGFKVVAR